MKWNYTHLRSRVTIFGHGKSIGRINSQFVDLAKYRSLSYSSVVSCEGANGWEAVRFARFTFAAHYRTSMLELSKEGDLEKV